MTCPNCGSNEWKSASLVYEEGRSVTNTKGSFGGYGISTGGIGIAGGKLEASGKTVSDLSKKAAPPRPFEEPVLFVILGILGVLFSLFAFWIGPPFFGGILFLVSIVIMLFPGFFPSYFSDEKRERAGLEYAKWRHTRMCTRCGHFYVEEQHRGKFTPTHDPSRNAELRKKYPY